MIVASMPICANVPVFASRLVFGKEEKAEEKLFVASPSGIPLLANIHTLPYPHICFIQFYTTVYLRC
jgi:hypothetical protein